MHLFAGAHVAPHFSHVPSLAFAHCLYVRSAGSYMHASAGVHGEPKWKHEPAPPLRHVKYPEAPGWNAQLGVGQPTSRATRGFAPEPCSAPDPVFVPAPEPPPLGPVGPVRAGLPQPAEPPAIRPATETNASTIAGRTARL